MPFDDDVQPLDDRDEFRTKLDRYPQVVPGTISWNPKAMKQEVEIRCQAPGCNQTRIVFVSDLFQIKLCVEHGRLERERKRLERMRRLELNRLPELRGGPAGMAEDIQPLDDRDDFAPDILCMMPDCMQPAAAGYEHCETHGGRLRRSTPPVSNIPVTEELGGMRPAHLLIKAKHDLSWVEYVDAEGNTKYMQVHDVRSARDAHGRWAVYGVDQDGETVHELYDLRHGYEHSGAFSGIRELTYGEIVKLAQQGVIRGEDGKSITTLSGLMRVADEPLRKLIVKKAKEAKAGGPSLEDIEKQIFAEPTKSSAQKRRSGPVLKI